MERTDLCCRQGGRRGANGNCPDLDSDGLPVQCVGEWADTRKHYYLRQYIEATREVRRKFIGENTGGAGYIDLFAGPGRIRLRDSGELSDGSPLIALGHGDAAFTHVVLCDIDERNVRALEARTTGRAYVVHGDSNACINDLVRAMPPDGLNLAVVDPFAIAPLRFATLRTLAQLSRVDLFINFPTGDIRRNFDRYYDSSSSVLETAIGVEDWRRTIDSLAKVHQVAELFIQKLADLGYTGESMRTVPVTNSNNAELYRIVFAAKHPLADKIWKSVIRNEPSGQRGFGFD